MPILDWYRFFTGLEAELESYFPRGNLDVLLRRAARPMGEQAAAGAGVDAALAAESVARLEPLENGFRLPPPFGDSPGLASWFAGFLEGAHPEHLAVRLEPDPAGGTRLLWRDAGEAAQENLHFDLPASGPLTPYQMAQLADLVVDAVLFVDTERRIRAWNRGAERLFGYTAIEAIGSYFDLLVPEDLRESGELETISEQTERLGQVHNHVTRRCTKDGRVLTVSLSRTLVHRRDGKLAGYGVILRDVSDEQRLQAQVYASRHLAALGELSAQVAHEVRNPLAGIHGAMQILRKRLSPGEEEREVFEEVAAQIARLDHLVTDLMRFGRPVARAHDTVSIGEWLQGWMQRIEREAASRGALVSVVVHQDGSVCIDPALLEQVLRNLFENAVEAADGPCKITLSVDGDGHEMHCDFHDDGPGIPADIRDRILEPFFTTKSRGSGLGLAICQRFLETLGGRLVLPQETGDGGGTTVRIVLPRDPRDQALS